jgi:hypothetical protein
LDIRIYISEELNNLSYKRIGIESTERDNLLPQMGKNISRALD